MIPSILHQEEKRVCIQLKRVVITQTAVEAIKVHHEAFHENGNFIRK